MKLGPSSRSTRTMCGSPACKVLLGVHASSWAWMQTSAARSVGPLGMYQALQIGRLRTMQLPHQLPWSSCLAAHTLCHCKACWQLGSCSSQV